VQRHSLAPTLACCHHGRLARALGIGRTKAYRLADEALRCFKWVTQSEVGSGHVCRFGVGEGGGQGELGGG
jgi:hypothetical protein